MIIAVYLDNRAEISKLFTVWDSEIVEVVIFKDKDKDKEFLFPMQQVFPLLQRQDRGQ